ncbi:MAG TPA: class I SAM-dependent methyltransferase [Streptosporangiaceae bacterium]|nr:class I SAM-dependent methyltransferase [Streptosporangiaceae bacterium]
MRTWCPTSIAACSLPGVPLIWAAGRDAMPSYLASLGFEVDAVDLSPVALAWGEERARDVGANVRFYCADIFTADLPPGRYDLVYDSGCLHHLPPHRRVSYLDLLDRRLAGSFPIWPKSKCALWTSTRQARRSSVFPSC